MNHFPNRLDVFREWHRILRPGRRALFTDPVVITGPVTNDELALRSSIGLFLFVPAGVNERLIDQAGFRLVQRRSLLHCCRRHPETILDADAHLGPDRAGIEEMR